ncbi:hydroxylamine reductase [Treponema sp. OMZ 792]|uniref:hydroxylamine reductase n=1 Tax=unclassified Treponema TaxID=2638727 RepID=UPI0020A3C021|nr:MULTISPECIES: hydroxylamine reductase [unclassified Treponema]UTC74741.1 hydroxylamine reductase [Treponema sp. OMZ 792]UTC81135.1 hydroxylamine reductase [Treponema sp. OMZ 798]
MNAMFCFQCQETFKNSGCIRVGVCGKNPLVAGLQDFLIWVTKKLSKITSYMRENGIKVEKEINHIVSTNLFVTITNANFDEKAINNRINITLKAIHDLHSSLNRPFDPEIEVYIDSDIPKRLGKAITIGVLQTKDPDKRSLKELIIYGLKGLCAYVKHANALGYEDEEVDAFIQKTLSMLIDENLSVDELISLTLKTGEAGVKGMALLDSANTGSYGNPEITEVSIGVRNNPGILVSGHDLKDIEMLLEQTEGTGIDVYTHSEMLPANYYPKLKKYTHLAGNYGNSWAKQVSEFESFNGPILMTTNCIIPTKASYLSRMYTTNAAGHPGCVHIEADENGYKDFSEIIKKAKSCQPPKEIETGKIVGGFAHAQVFALADKIVEAVKNGDIRKFIVMGGCDGRHTTRSYYTDFAEALPKNTVILTAGCAKYRYNKLNLGDINGIPRVLDAGQCNDSYSLALIALKLKEIFNLSDINDLPIIFNIAWYEQKAVIVLLALLFLGVKNIHLGPTIPGFLSPNVKDVLISKFGLSGISSIEDDIKHFFG